MSASRPIDESLLREFPLAELAAGGDKEARGRLVIIGGSASVPGAVLLSGTAALRAGAGKIQLAVPRALSIALGVAFPEAGILALDQTQSGEIACDGNFLRESLAGADVVLIGPGIMSAEAAREVTAQALQQHGPWFVIDAMALTQLKEAAPLMARHEGRIVLTPHAGEMAALWGVPKEHVAREALDIAIEVADQLRCTVVLKGARTCIADVEGRRFTHSLENVGLATAGSGDILAGIIAGLLARNNSAVTASLWGVSVHARAGAHLARCIGDVGFLARELLDQIPALLCAADTQGSTRGRRAAPAVSAGRAYGRQEFRTDHAAMTNVGVSEVWR